MPSFEWQGQTSLIPGWALGSPTPTSTRASTAYQQDFEAKLNLLPSGAARMQGARVVQNALTFTETLSNAAWTKINGGTGSAPTVTSGFTAPDGSLTAWRVQADRGAGNTGSDYSIVRSAAGTGNQRSIYAKSNTGASQTFSLLSGNAPSLITVTTSWQRMAALDVPAIQFDIGNLGSDGGTRSLDILVWHPQLENTTGQTNTAPGEYVPSDTAVYSAPWTGANVSGVQYFSTLNGNTVASNVVTEATGAAIVTGAAGVATTAPVDANGPLGIVTEPSQANLLGTTAAIVRTMTDVGWVATTMTVATTVGVDGVTASGARLTATGANATILFTPGLLAAVRTYAPSIKRITGTGAVSTTGDVADGYVAQTLTAAYAQYPLVTTSAVPVVGFKIATSGDVIDVDFNQLVAGSIAPAAPIPVGVTTAADVEQYVSAGNLASTNSGTMNITPVVALGSAVVFHLGTYVDASNYTAVLSDGTNLIARKRIAGANHDATIAWIRTAGIVAKVGWRFDTVNGSDIWLNGTKGTNDATLTAAQIGTNFQVGSDGNGASQDYSEHRLLNVYPVALPVPRLSAMTTP